MAISDDMGQWVVAGPHQLVDILRLNLCRSHAVVVVSLCPILHHPHTSIAHHVQVYVGYDVPLIRCKAVESCSLCHVLHNTQTFTEHVAHFVLSPWMLLFRCKAKESKSHAIVLRNTLTVQVAVSQA